MIINRSNPERGSASLVAVVALFALALVLVLTSLTLGTNNVKDTGETNDNLDAYYMALAGVNDSMAEIIDATDGGGDRASGLGALGITAPIDFVDSSGDVVGQYRSYILNKAADPDNDPPYYVVRVIAAVPNFQTPRATYAMETHISAKQEFALAPNTGAISVSGPLNRMTLDAWGSSEFQITGNEAPAIVLTDSDAFNEALDKIGDEFANGNLDGSEITGNPTVTFDHEDYDPSSTYGEFDTSVLLSSDVALSADELNAYRDALRGYAEDLVYGTPTADGGSVDVDYATAAANGVVVVHELDDVKDGAGAGKPRIVSDHTFGSVGSEQTVLIDTSQFEGGGDSATDNHDRTITGAGTLVILHPIGSSSDNANGKQFNLNWTGDVIVVGYPDDRTTGVGENNRTDNLLYISRTDWDIEGNLIVVAAGQTEASLEMRGSGADPANLNVNGSVLMFAEATTQEAEIDIEGNANFNVDGIVGMYGSRIELENQSSVHTTMSIDGTLAIGLPDGNTRNDDFFFETRGDAKFNFDQGAVDNAVESLTELQSELKFTNEIPSALHFNDAASRSSAALFDEFNNELVALIANDGPNGDGEFGVDLQLIQDNAN